VSQIEPYLRRRILGENQTVTCNVL